ncbi:MAG: penicillin-binding protein activator [Hellea sp.]|nr:penicillin-binding protein activator [Hellea sp.]
MTGKTRFEQSSTKLKWLTLTVAIVAVSACTTTTTPPQQGPVVNRPVPQTQQPIPQAPKTETKAPEIKQPETTVVEQVMRRDGLTPPHMAGRDIKRMAILLPFSSGSSRLRAEAASMLKAAELAVFNRDDADVVLIALDTGGTETGAASATDAALKSGVDVILGPVLSRSVSGASRKARKNDVPVIAFSTDQTVAGNGTYLLSFPPEAEVKRIVDYAASTGVQRFAYIGPQSEYGRRVMSAYTASVRENAGELRASETYDGNDISVMQGPARNLANAYRAHEKTTQPTDRQHFEAVILPEGGVPLRSLAPLLPYYDIDPEKVQFLGTSLWHKEEVVREPAINGGIFAGPDQDARQRFAALYDQQFAEDPSRLASLAYDAVKIGAVIADGPAKTRRQRAEDPTGFFGVDGLVRWAYDGRPDRGLAVYQIQNGRFVIIDPAPSGTPGPT